MLKKLALTIDTITKMTKKMKNLRNLILILLLLLLPGSVYSALDYKNAQLHGFIMQSYVKTNKNNFFGSSTGKGSFDYTEIGVNGSVKLSSNFQLASQLLSRRAGRTDDGEIKLDFALADYRIIDKFKYGLGLRAGRVKNPIGFYNETRDVSFTRESIILPQSIYFERTRDVSLSADGLHLYGYRQTRFGMFNGQLATVYPRVTGINTEYALLGGVKPGAFVAKPSFGGQLKFESSDSRTTLALSHVNLFMEYDPADIETTFTTNGNVHFYMTIFSLKYNLLQWSFTSEYAQRSIRFDGFPSVYIPDPLRSTTGESFYFQTVYRLNYKWNLIARYDVLYSDKNDRDGETFVQSMSALGANIENHSRYAKDMMFGIQFNISRHWESRLELHAVDGSAWIPARDNLNEPVLVRKWNMINMSISYQF